MMTHLLNPRSDIVLYGHLKHVADVLRRSNNRAGHVDVLHHKRKDVHCKWLFRGAHD